VWARVTRVSVREGGDNNGEIWKQVRETFAAIPGYTTRWDLVRAGDYGVPQNRPRVLLVGIRNDVAKAANWDPDSDQNEIAPASGLLPTPTGEPALNLVDVLGDLIDDDEANWNGGKTDYYPSSADSRNKIQAYFRTGLDGTMASKNSPLTEHEYSKHSDHINRKFQAMIDNDGVIPEEMRTKKFAQRLLPEKWGRKARRSLPLRYLMISFIMLSPEFSQFENGLGCKRFQIGTNLLGSGPLAEYDAQVIHEQVYITESYLSTRR
jgi:site-specific DNA-cytosine methylase